jgi:hypothetical protein
VTAGDADAGRPGDKPGMNLDELAGVLKALGCPASEVGVMASQLDKRARQLASQKERSYDEALAHLLKLMRQGWAAREKLS